MMNIVKKAALGFTLAASTLVAAAPAEAQYRGDRYRRHHNNDAAVAIGAGVLGLAVGAAIASGDRRGGYYDRGYYDRGYNGGYYYDRPRYYRPRYYDSYRYDRPHYRYSYRERCYRDRVWDDYRGRWVRVRRCR